MHPAPRPAPQGVEGLDASRVKLRRQSYRAGEFGDGLLGEEFGFELFGLSGVPGCPGSPFLSEPGRRGFLVAGCFSVPAPVPGEVPLGLALGVPGGFGAGLGSGGGV